MVKRNSLLLLLAIIVSCTEVSNKDEADRLRAENDSLKKIIKEDSVVMAEQAKIMRKHYDDLIWDSVL